MTKTEVVVFAAPGRDEAHALSYASLRASDIGEDFQVSEHPPGIGAQEHWLRTHELAARAKSEFVIVLEDDVLVNAHILHNVDSWRYKHQQTFGAGWLYAPGGYSRRDTWYSGSWDWYGTCGVLYETKRLPFLIETAWARMTGPLKQPWDLAISWACHLDGRRIRVHHPALVEHLNELPSKLGNPTGGRRDSGGTFHSTWQRPDRHEHGVIDQWGRNTI